MRYDGSTRERWEMTTTVGWIIAAGLVLFGAEAGAQSGRPRSVDGGTTLSASKTLDICKTDDEQWWHYSGQVVVQNNGAVETEGLAIRDCLQRKVGDGPFEDVLCQDLIVPGQIAPGETATFTYAFEIPPVEGELRNIAQVTITNHSGSLGVPKGPEPKAAWAGYPWLAPEPDTATTGEARITWKLT